MEPGNLVQVLIDSSLWIGVSIIAFVLLIMAIILGSEFLHLVRINSL